MLSIEDVNEMIRIEQETQNHADAAADETAWRAMDSVRHLTKFGILDNDV